VVGDRPLRDRRVRNGLKNFSKSAHDGLSPYGCWRIP
jgi:hypothetical protein